MFNAISTKITDILIKHDCISKENSELYSYGFRQLFMMLLNISITLLLGIIFNKVLQSILFSIIYIPIRSFAGGYHAKTPLRCTTFSTLMIFLVLLILKFIVLPIYVVVLLWLISIGTIISLSPVESRNKPLDTIEKSVYKKRTIFLLMLDSVIIIVFMMFSLNQLYTCVVLSLVSLSVMLLLGSFNNKTAT
ncbi:MAG: accessory gene regulator B family protein [Oscillospiraceae bacterium]